MPPSPPGPRQPEGPAGRPSLKDVARLAGVSVMTVSNVVRGAPNVSDTTRSRVLRVVQEVGYRPNSSARSLRAGRSNVVTLAIPAIDNPYFAELARRMMDQAADLGWTVLIEQTRGSLEGEQRALAGAREAPTEGLVLFPQAMDRSLLATHASNHPMVLLGDRGYQGPGDVIVIDNERGAAQAVTHLTDLGRRRIAALGVQTSPATEVSRRRLAGYRAALDAAGLRYDPDLVVPVADYTRASGAAAMDRLLGRGNPPDALFAFNDLLAIGAMHHALRHGLRIPEDLAIAGFDDIDEARFSNPTLTSVAPDKAAIAQHAMRALHARITCPDPAPYQHIRLEHRLRVRDSSAPSAPD